MSSKICVNAKKLAYIMFENEYSVEQVKIAIKEIPQPSQGYYAITEIYKYMRGDNLK